MEDCIIVEECLSLRNILLKFTILAIIQAKIQTEYWQLETESGQSQESEALK